MKDFKINSQELLVLQKEQYRHDQRNHSDIACLAKSDRLKHYGLHFAKYVGRLARGSTPEQPVERTVVDTALVGLSAANTLHQHLEAVVLPAQANSLQLDPILTFADAAGRFADACEKIDHLEEFLPIAKRANADIVNWALHMAAERRFDLVSSMRIRRAELADRQFFIAD